MPTEVFPSTMTIFVSPWGRTVISKITRDINLVVITQIVLLILFYYYIIVSIITILIFGLCLTFGSQRPSAQFGNAMRYDFFKLYRWAGEVRRCLIVSVFMFSEVEQVKTSYFVFAETRGMMVFVL